MWQKIEIISKEIPNITHNGFTYDLSGNIITNTDKTISIKMPFKMINIKNLYNFELFFNNQKLSVNFYVNIYELRNIINKNKSIPNKNNLFNILKCYMSNINYDIRFNKLVDVNNIISYFDLIQNKNKNVFIINNLKFNLQQESIDICNDKNLSVADLHFYFTSDNSIINMSKNKLCIIDDSYNYLTKNNIIDCTNYKSITKKFIENNNYIIIDKTFFLSARYIYNYKKFHNQYTSSYCYDNYKKFINNSNQNTNVFNIELFDNYTLIFKNIYPNQLLLSPILYSRCKKIFIIDKIDNQIISDCQKLSIINTKKKEGNNYSITDKIGKSDFFYMYNSIFHLDEARYTLFKKLDAIPKLNIDNPIKSSKIDSYNSFNFPVEDTCFINYRKIKKNSYIKFNCGHKYIAKDINHFLSNNTKCPQCQQEINTIDIYFYCDNILSDILGSDFYYLYETYYTYNHIVIGNFPIKLSKFIQDNYNNIIFINEDCSANYNKYSIVYFYNISDQYKILNYASKININKITNIFNICSS